MYSAQKVSLADIQPFRALFLQEANFQVRYNACHERGWTDSYRLLIGDSAAGYGSIKGREIEDRDTIFEFFVVPPFRSHANLLFRQLLLASGAQYIESQSNDFLLTAMLFEFSSSISSDVVLFADHEVTHYSIPGAVVRRRGEDDHTFGHRVEPIGDYVLDRNGDIIATGGFLLHYNHPFADLYMEVREDSRRQGAGSLLIQEMKKECYLAGRVPAARCSLTNYASRATLLKAGLAVSGFLLMGRVRT